MIVDTWPTVAEAAKELGVSGQYIRSMIDQGKITASLRAKTLLIDPASWAAFKQDRARRLASQDGRKEARRVAALIDAGKMGTIKHDDLVKLIAENAHAAVGD